jgi:hypothetical protein
LFGHLWVVEETYIYIFAFKFTFRCQQPDKFILFATGVNDTGIKFAAGIVDTGGKFATGVNNKGNWWQHLQPVSLIPVANLPPVSLILAAICTLTCEFLCEFSKKFEMILILLSGAWGKVIHEKNLKQKIS